MKEPLTDPEQDEDEATGDGADAPPTTDEEPEGGPDPAFD